ncbi:MAG: hypothetical protein WKF87_21055 [Chryseolinea sp.]
MQEIKKRRIVLASILKPVNDPRMFEKLATTLAPHYEVHVIGHSTRQVTNSENITQHTIGPFDRISLVRLLSSFAVLRKILQLRPLMLIVCTHELLFVGILAKMITGCRIVYDIQENYARNIYYGKAFPLLLRPVLAAYVRLKELTLSRMYHHFFLAEKLYQRELAFIRHRCTILENKVKQDHFVRHNRNNDSDSIQLLFSGTIADTTGVFTAIDVATRLHAVDSRVHLVVIGFAAQTSIRSRLISEVKGKSFIELKGIDHIIQHEDIREAINASDFGVISYPRNRSTEGSMPTKLYEYLGCQLPILLIDHQPWVAYCKIYPAAVVFDPGHLNPERLMCEMEQTHFYQRIPTDVYWEPEGEKLLDSTLEILSATSER